MCLTGFFFQKLSWNSKNFLGFLQFFCRFSHSLSLTHLAFIHPPTQARFKFEYRLSVLGLRSLVLPQISFLELKGLCSRVCLPLDGTIPSGTKWRNWIDWKIIGEGHEGNYGKIIPGFPYHTIHFTVHKWVFRLQSALWVPVNPYTLNSIRFSLRPFKSNEPFATEWAVLSPKPIWV